MRNESNLHEKIALAIALQHIATADDCLKIIDDPDLLARACARSKNYAYQNWKAHLSGALRPDCGLARLWEPQIQEYARTRARVF